MRRSLLRPLPILALVAAATALAACSGGSSSPAGGSEGPEPLPEPTECGSVYEGSWFFDVHSLTGGPVLASAVLTQNGCLVFVEQAPWRISGTLDGASLWDAEITRAGEVVGKFTGTFSGELESPLFRFDSEFDGDLDGDPLIEVIGLFNPAALALASYAPSSASIAGGAELLVTGNGFFDFELTFVFDGRPAEVLELIDDRTARVLLPASDAPGTVDVSVFTSDEPGGAPTKSFTLSASFTYSACRLVTAGAWDVTLNGLPASGSFMQADCVATLALEAAKGAPLISFTGPVDALGGWSVQYLVDGAPLGAGQASFTGEPATSFEGSMNLDAGGALVITGAVAAE